MADPNIDVKITADIASLRTAMTQAENAVKNSTDSMARSADRAAIGRRLSAGLDGFQGSLGKTTRLVQGATRAMSADFSSGASAVSSIGAGVMMLPHPIAKAAGAAAMLAAELSKVEDGFGMIRVPENATVAADELTKALKEQLAIERELDPLRKLELEHARETRQITEQYAKDRETIRKDIARELNFTRQSLANEEMRVEKGKILAEQERDRLQQERERLQILEKEQQLLANTERYRADMDAAQIELRILKETDPTLKRQLQTQQDLIRIKGQSAEIEKLLGYEAAVAMYRQQAAVANQQELNDLLEIELQKRKSMPSNAGSLTTSLGGQFNYVSAGATQLANVAAAQAQAAAAAGAQAGQGGTQGAAITSNWLKTIEQFAANMYQATNAIELDVDYMNLRLMYIEANGDRGANSAEGILKDTTYIADIVSGGFEFLHDWTVEVKNILEKNLSVPR